jgi:hypothetical protein
MPDSRDRPAHAEAGARQRTIDALPALPKRAHRGLHTKQSLPGEIQHSAASGAAVRAARRARYARTARIRRSSFSPAGRPSLLKIVLTCFCTAPWLMVSRSPIACWSGLRRPTRARSARAATTIGAGPPPSDLPAVRRRPADRGRCRRRRRASGGGQFGDGVGETTHSVLEGGLGEVGVSGQHAGCAAGGVAVP